MTMTTETIQIIRPRSYIIVENIVHVLNISLHSA